MGEHRITDLDTPLTPYDATNKEYVDEQVGIVSGDVDSLETEFDEYVSETGKLIPSAASESNKLADKAWVSANHYSKSDTYNKSEVDQKIQTETATFKGNFDKWSDVPFDGASMPFDWGEPDNNDYMVVRDASGYAPFFVLHDVDAWYYVGDYVLQFDSLDSGRLFECIAETDASVYPDMDEYHWQPATSNPNYEGTWRFKYVGSGEYDVRNWLPEYQINEVPLTPSQLAALNSGITEQKVAKLDSLPSDMSGYLQKSGGTMTGVLNMGGKKLTNLTVPIADSDAVPRSYVDTAVGTKQNKAIDILVHSGNYLHVSPTSNQPISLLITGSNLGGAYSLLMNMYAYGDNYAEVTDINGFSNLLTDSIVYSDGAAFFLHFSGNTDVSVFVISGECVVEEVNTAQEDPDYNRLIPAPLSSKQDELIDGENIATINNQSLLEGGNIDIDADTSDCVKFGETISATNNYLKINGAGVPFSLMLVVTMDLYTSEYLVNGAEQRVEIIKMNGEQSFDGMLRIDADTYFPIALYHEDSLTVTPVLLSGTMPIITDLASASGDEEEIPYYLDSNSIKTINNTSLLGSGNIDVDEVFVATYGSTTYSEITAALSSGKAVFAKLSNGEIAPLSSAINSKYYFGRVFSGILYTSYVGTNDSWNNANVQLTTSWGSTPSDSKYPSEKLVKDTIDALHTIPSGGTAGQVLTKASGTDYDVEWANGGGGSSDVFVAEYGVTTASDIESAISAGKIVVCFYNDACYTFGRLETNYIYLSTTRQERYYNIAIHRTNNTWQTLSATFELSSNKVSTLSGNETSTTKYPNTKAVADALGKWGVISQTQTWSGSGASRTYTMSNLVTGLIPQANIDIFVRAGATFNDQTGYFELNGLTDLSYNEMMDIMRFGDMPYALASWMYQVKPIRTNFPPLRYLVNNIDTAFRDCDIEVIAFNQGANGTKLASSGADYAFYSCRNLKKMIGVLDITTSTSGARFIQYAALLESFQIKGLKFSVEFSTPYMDKDSLLYLINNEASTGAITITLLASVYAKCQSGGEWYSDISTALAAHTNVSLASA